MRNLAVVVSALAALAAQAQQAQNTAPAASASVATGTQESTERPVTLASRTNSGSTSGEAQTVAPGESPGAGTKSRNIAATGIAGSDCSIVETYLGGGDLAVRSYAPPASEASGAKGWKQVPYVAAVAHCGQLFIFQVQSRSREAWVIRQARLEGPNGEVLQVAALFSKVLLGQRYRSVNVIVARASAGAKLSRVRLDLSGEDGRVAQAEAGDLP